MKKLKLQFKIQTCLIMVVLFLITVPVFAAEISFDVKSREIRVGQQFQIDLVLDSENEAVNAIEGKIVFPAEMLELKEIRDGNSIINFWVERPAIPPIETNISNKHEIIFSGIVPGGYQGEKGTIFSIIFQARQEGQALIEIMSAKTLLNDGKGTKAKTISRNLLVSIVSGISDSPPVILKDEEPPESFIPEIAREPNVFDGKWFLVFATQDKGSGIARYQVKEARQKVFSIFSRWHSAESPYLLKDQEIKSQIYVRAIDKNGNKRIAVLSPQNHLLWYENWLILGAIVLILIITGVITGKFLWKKAGR